MRASCRSRARAESDSRHSQRGRCPPMIYALDSQAYVMFIDAASKAAKKASLDTGQASAHKAMMKNFDKC